MACLGILFSVGFPSFDNVNRWVLTYTTELQQEQPALYESLTKILEPADQQVLQAVIHEAEKISQRQQQQQQQQQQQNLQQPGS